MTRRSIGGAILVAWAGSLVWLGVRHNTGSTGVVLDDAIRTVPPGASFYVVSLAGKPIGFASSTVDTVPDGVVVDNRLMLDIPVLGTVQRTETRTVANLSNALRLQTFEAGLRGANGHFDARGEVVGDTVLAITLESPDSRQALRIDLDEPIVLPALLPLRVAFGGGLTVGETYTLQVFDPMLLQHRDYAITVQAESTMVVPDSAAFDSLAMRWVPARWDTVQAWQVEQRVGGVTQRTWVDELGRVVSGASPVGFEIARAPFEVAFYNFRNRDSATVRASLVSGDIIRETAIAADVLPTVLAAPSLRVRLSGVDLTPFDLAGGRQTMVGDTLLVVREALDSLPSTYRLPADTADHAKDLGPEPLIQVDDPRIQAQARQIVGRVRDPRRAAELLNTWIYQHLEKRVTISVPSAVEALETTRGDCNEHTVLYVALARAVGLPTRTAAGLAYVGGNFYYHAWPEVYLGDTWVAVDPTFGQFPADAAHLRFTIGGLARQIELIRLIGHLTLDVIEPGES